MITAQITNQITVENGTRIRFWVEFSDASIQPKAYTYIAEGFDVEVLKSAIRTDLASYNAAAELAASLSAQDTGIVGLTITMEG